MGDIADMMLDGTLCAGCGEYLGSEFCVLSYCSGCENPNLPKKPAKAGGLVKLPRVKCAQCERWISPRGMQKHIHDKHAGPAK